MPLVLLPTCPGFSEMLCLMSAWGAGQHSSCGELGQHKEQRWAWVTVTAGQAGTGTSVSTGAGPQCLSRKNGAGLVTVTKLSWEPSAHQTLLEVRGQARKSSQGQQGPHTNTPTAYPRQGQLCAAAPRGSGEAPAGFSQHSGPRLHRTGSGQPSNTGSQTCRTGGRGCRVSWQMQSTAQSAKNTKIIWSADRRTWVQTCHKRWQCERLTILKMYQGLVRTDICRTLYVWFCFPSPLGNTSFKARIILKLPLGYNDKVPPSFSLIT